MGETVMAMTVFAIAGLVVSALATIVVAWISRLGPKVAFVVVLVVFVPELAILAAKDNIRLTGNLSITYLGCGEQSCPWER